GKRDELQETEAGDGEREKREWWNDEPALIGGDEKSEGGCGEQCGEDGGARGCSSEPERGSGDGGHQGGGGGEAQRIGASGARHGRGEDGHATRAAPCLGISSGRRCCACWSLDRRARATAGSCRRSSASARRTRRTRTSASRPRRRSRVGSERRRRTSSCARSCTTGGTPTRSIRRRARWPAGLPGRRRTAGWWVGSQAGKA